MRCVMTFAAVLLIASGCASTGSKTAAHKTKSSAAGKPRIEIGTIDDFALTEGTTEDTTYFLSVADDGVSAPLPEFAFSSGDSREDPLDAMFPAEPGTVDDAIGEPAKPVVRVFTVAAESAIVRAHPNSGAAVVRVVPRGKELVGLTDGQWARIGKGQFVEVSALKSGAGQGAATQQSRLGTTEH